MSYALVLQKMYGDKDWSITGDTYDGIVWNDSDPKPTDADLKAKFSQAEAKNAAAQEIIELQTKLARTDYVALPDYDQSKPEVLTQRQQWRDRIRQLEQI